MGKSIKDQNRWQLWLAIAANFIVFYVLMQWDEIAVAGFKGLIMMSANLLPVGLAIVVTTVINGLLSSDAKARIVFLRWKHALPGHRAFSGLAPKDPRIDLARLEKVCGGSCPMIRVSKTKHGIGSIKVSRKGHLSSRLSAISC